MYGWLSAAPKMGDVIFFLETDELFVQINGAAGAGRGFIVNCPTEAACRSKEGKVQMLLIY
jgi:hypothetical protein